MNTPWENNKQAEDAQQQNQSPTPKQELATFRLLYETKRLCLFETRDGHVTAVRTSRLG